MNRPDVLIVGGGLAGLCCGRELARRGISFQILEASDGVGGRVRTDEVEGFRLDRGFQIYLTAYPEGKRVLDLAALDLKPFTRGALVRINGKFHRVADPRQEPKGAVTGLFNPVGSLADKLRMLRLFREVNRGAADDFGSQPNASAADYLTRTIGFSPTILGRLFRPFFGGVSLDRSLSTSARFFRFTTRMFTAGLGAVPAMGMEAIPRQLAAALSPDAIRLNARVTQVSDNGVTLASGETLNAKAIVVAVEAPVAARLLGDRVPDPGSNGNTTLYYAATQPPITEPILMLDSEERGPVNSLVVMSNASPAYAPPGYALLSASIIGIPQENDAELDRRAREQFREWFGAEVDAWRLLKVYRIPHALPNQQVGRLDPWRRPVRLAAGLFVCGDHRDNGSIDGAMTSGRRAAEAVVAELR